MDSACIRVGAMSFSNSCKIFYKILAIPAAALHGEIVSSKDLKDHWV